MNEEDEIILRMILKCIKVAYELYGPNFDYVITYASVITKWGGARLATKTNVEALLVVYESGKGHLYTYWNHLIRFKWLNWGDKFREL